MVLIWMAITGLLEFLCVSWDNWCIANLLTADSSCTSMGKNNCVGKVRFSLVMLAWGFRKYWSHVHRLINNLILSSSLMSFLYVYKPNNSHKITVQARTETLRLSQSFSKHRLYVQHDVSPGEAPHTGELFLVVYIVPYQFTNLALVNGWQNKHHQHWV